MKPARKRKIRLVTALSAAVLLAVALVYTSVNASSETVVPERSRDRAGRHVLPADRQGAGRLGAHDAGGVDFRVRDRDGTTSVPVTYTGVVSDAFREDREVIVTVRKEGALFVGERDSLITKCPSKFTEDATKSQNYEELAPWRPSAAPC